MRKKLFILIFIVLSVNIVQASKSFYGWFHFTPKAGIGNSVLYNNAMSDIKNVDPSIFNISYFVGGQIGVGISEIIDLSFEMDNYIFKQSYSIESELVKYDKTLKFNNLDYGIVLKVIAGSGYLEIGALKTNIKKIIPENKVKENLTGNALDFNDNTDFFNTEHISLIGGLGATLVQQDLFELTAGIRIKYSLNPYATGPELPLKDNVYQGILKNDMDSRNLSIMLQLEFHNFFGYFGRAICGSARVLFFKKPKIKWQ